MVYDKQFPLLDTTVEFDEVVLLAVQGRVVDPHFRNNYLAATEAADAGRVKSIVVKVDVIAADGWLHTVGAVDQALAGQKLHAAAKFYVDADVNQIGELKLTKVLEHLAGLVVPKPEADPVEDEVVAERPTRTRAKKSAPADEAEKVEGE